MVCDYARVSFSETIKGSRLLMNALDICKFCFYFSPQIQPLGECRRYPKWQVVQFDHQCGEYITNPNLSIGMKRNTDAPGSALIDMMLERD